MNNEEYNDPATLEHIKMIESELKYLEKEGVVVKMSNGNYRIKTQKEIQQEIQNIINS